ncbi:MAG: nusA [Gammaproteobacteria bacterium]|jgi:N utilization substance protein A|nr:nusA [Gammaproteobacteria bacterium]
MLNKEILNDAERVSNEKNVPQELVIEAIEKAISAAARKHFGVTHTYEAKVDRAKGSYLTFRVWQVVESPEQIENPDSQLLLVDAQAIDPNAEVGGVVKQQIDSVEFGRIGARMAKQVMGDEIRIAERQQIVEQFKPKEGTLVNGIVRKVMRDVLFVDVGGGVEAVLSRQDMIPREIFRVGDRLRALLFDVHYERRGALLHLSRTHKEMLTALFKIEVPEIAEDVIEIISAARDPGARSKILVKTNDGRVDPVGACVGMRGARVQAVSSELNGEKIDIVLWSDNPAQLVMNAMSPAEIVSMVVDEESRTMDLAVAPEQLAQAIGRNGQNVRLASELTGWKINVMTPEDLETKRAKEASNVKETFVRELEVDEEVADVLVREGFSSLEEIAYVPLQEMAAIEEFDEEIAEALQARAKDVLLTKAISEEVKHHQLPAEDLLSLQGMTEALAKKLAAHNIVSREDLAEQSAMDLLDIADDLITQEQASKLVLEARKHWFK